MTKFQAYLAGYGLFVIGAALALTGALIKNDALMGFGFGVAGSGMTALNVPRPNDI